MLLAYKTFIPEPTIHYTYTRREAPAVDNPPKQRKRPRSRTRDSNPKLSRLPMSQDETHELPLPRRIHTTTSTTAQRERGQYQHASRSDQKILRHPIQRQKPRRVAPPQRRENLAIKRHSGRDHTSAKEPVLNNSQRIIRRSGRALRVPAHLPPLKLDQANPPRRRLRSRPWKNGASQGSGCANKRGQSHTQPVAACRDESRHRILHHRAVVQKRRKHPRRVLGLRRHHNGRRRQGRTPRL